MFLKINTVETKRQKTRGAETLSDAVKMLGAIAGIVVRRSSQTERQLSALHKSLGRLTKFSSVDFRNSVFNYGEARFWGQPPYTQLGPELQRVVDEYVLKAKAA